MKATKLAFERRYSDDSGVEQAVSYDSTKVCDEIRFERHGSYVCFSSEDIEWLRDALYEIKCELPDKPKEPPCSG